MYNLISNPGAAQDELASHGAPAASRTPTAGGGTPHLINSKLKPPLLAAACIDRPALQAHLDAASHRKLLLVAAPIGSGKTTLLTQWHRHIATRRSFAWLSLDERDNEPLRFFSYLIAALRNAVAGFQAYIPQRFDDPALPLDPAAAVFSECLERIEQDLIILLDDFQWLGAPALVRTIDYLVHRSAPNVHWVIAGRCVPQLRLSQLRLADQLTTIDATDLNFDRELIVQLGRKLCRRELLPHQADGIHARTEGWVAGVKLALLAAADSTVADNTLQHFTGSHHEVARYLATSVLQEQSAQVREFLVASSIVDRMTAELCNALLGISHSQSLLEQLERSQLFIQPLDSHGQWYRYHTLFLDFLRTYLRHDSTRTIWLHERASRWLAEHQLYEEALHHAFLTRNGQWCLELVARCVRLWLQEGEIGQVLRWCEKLPRDEVRAHPEVCSAYISALIFSRRFTEAMTALREVEANASACLAQGPVPLHLLHRMLRILADSSDATVPAPQGLGDAAADKFLSGTVLTLQAYALLRRNQFNVAWRLAMRARDILEPVSIYALGYADAVASLAERAQGDLKSAAERCERMFARLGNGRRNPTWVNAATALAYVRYEENRLSEAQALCIDVLPLLSVASTIENLTFAYLTLARIKAINGRSGEALQLLDYLHAVLESGCHRRFLAQVCREKMRINLLQGNWLRAQALATEFGIDELARADEWGQRREYDAQWEYLGSAHVLLLEYQKLYGEARRILALLRDSAREAGYVYRQIALEAALAQACWYAGEQAAAFESLNRGLALTRGYGYSRSVFDETPALTQIIAAAVKSQKLAYGLNPRYLCRFGDVLGENVTPAASAAPKGKSALPLEPLTEREIEMLRLLARGLSNSEISTHSHIALSTAKWHLKNVFAKLDVSTRTAAIARARELQLIE